MWTRMSLSERLQSVELFIATSVGKGTDSSLTDFERPYKGVEYALAFECRKECALGWYAVWFDCVRAGMLFCSAN